MHKGKFSFISLGCARTLVDSEGLINDLTGKGFQLVNENAGEETVVLNTCSFIQSAVDETEKNIQDLIQKKQANQIKYLVVVGCYPSRFKKTDLTQKFPEVDLWLKTNEENQLKEALTALVFQDKYQPSKPVKYTRLTP